MYGKKGKSSSVIHCSVILHFVWCIAFNGFAREGMRTVDDVDCVSRSSCRNTDMTSVSQVTLLYLQYRQAQCAVLTDHDKCITGHVTLPEVSSGPVCRPN